jgi:hypothetical protein
MTNLLRNWPHRLGREATRFPQICHLDRSEA